MKKGRLQCKDIPTIPILEYLNAVPMTRYQTREWAMGFSTNEGNFNVTRAMPPGTPQKLVNAKMAQLISSGLVDGCRGDYVITAKGVVFLEALKMTQVDFDRWYQMGDAAPELKVVGIMARRSS